MEERAVERKVTIGEVYTHQENPEQTYSVLGADLSTSYVLEHNVVLNATGIEQTGEPGPIPSFEDDSLWVKYRQNFEGDYSRGTIWFRKMDDWHRNFTFTGDKTF